MQLYFENEKAFLLIQFHLSYGTDLHPYIATEVVELCWTQHKSYFIVFLPPYYFLVYVVLSRLDISQLNLKVAYNFCFSLGVI